MRVGSVVLHCHVLCRDDVSVVLEELVPLLCVEESLASLAACVMWSYFRVANYRGDDDCIVSDLRNVSIPRVKHIMWSPGADPAHHDKT